MSDTISADVCVVGAGPVGGTLACRLAAAGVSTVLVDRAALPPMEHPAFDGRAYAIAAGARVLRRRIGDYLGAVRTVGRRWHYPLSAMLAHRYVDTRLALVGDAAHGIHPIAGQGLNLGFRDVIALADLVIAAKATDEDIGGPGLLTGYQRARRPDNIAMLAMTDGLDRLFSTDRRVVRLARDLGIAAVDRSGPLKKAFMRAAMGG